MNFQTVRPIAKAGLTSAVILSSGDVLCQCITNDKRRKEVEKSNLDASKVEKYEISLERSARFAWTGLTLHGPYFYFAYAW